MVYHWNVKSIKYRSRFVTSNNAPAKHQSWATNSRMTFDTICKVHYTFCCNNSQESIVKSRFMFWCEFDYFFDLTLIVSCEREQYYCTLKTEYSPYGLVGQEPCYLNRQTVKTLHSAEISAMSAWQWQSCITRENISDGSRVAKDPYKL